MARIPVRWSLMALCIVWPTLAAAEMPQIGAVVNYVAAKVQVRINGVPVQEIDVDKDTSGGTGMQLTDWLVNGDNEIVLAVEANGERARAEIKVQDFTSRTELLALTQEGAGEKTATLKVEGVPAWAWERAVPQEDAGEDLLVMLKELHTAYSRSDVDTVIEISAPFFADQKLTDGLSVEMFQEHMGPMLKRGKLEDLPEVTVSRHLDGRLFRVVAADGKAPVRITMEEDGLKNTMRMGEWWSMIDGAWRVVR